MDPKAAAKSKRSQSQQGKRNHPTPSALSARAQQKKKEQLPQQKQHQQGEQRSRRDLRALPSNWDRFEEDETEVEPEGGPTPPLVDSDGSPAAATMPLSGGGETVVKKSRGADFGRLIEDARSQIPQRDRSDAASALASANPFDQGMTDLTPLVSVRGESLLAWCSNDNFTVDTSARSSFEVPFLSLDLQALAAHISKLAVAERLFIEEDFLPTELHDVSSSGEECPQRVDPVVAHEVSERSRVSLTEVERSKSLKFEGAAAGSVPVESFVDALLAEGFSASTWPPAGPVPVQSSVDELLAEGFSPSTWPPAGTVPVESSVDELLAESFSASTWPPAGTVPVESSVDELLAESFSASTWPPAGTVPGESSVDELLAEGTAASTWTPAHSVSLESSIDELLAEADLLAPTSSGGAKRRDLLQTPRAKFHG